jgi:DNA-binding transcriptional ArsR family regulator
VDALHAVFDSVARYFSVLGEPTRLRILHTLCQQEKCVADILKGTGLAPANASRHLGVMYQAGMVSRRREGSQIFYKVADPLSGELCRAVSVQMAAHPCGVAFQPAALHGAIPPHSRQPKGKESV